MSTAHVLIIDDDPAVLTALPEMFRLWLPGAVVDLCGSARLALDRIEAVDYDAIISDIRMPDMDGLTLLEHIKTIRPNTPTLLVTGYGDQTLAMHALRGGAYDYILKPVDRDYLLASVNRAIHLRHLSRHAEEHKHIEQSLRERQRLLEAVIEAVPYVLVVTDREGRLLLFNRAAEALTKYGRDEVLGQSIFDLLIPQQCAADVRERFTRLDEGEHKPHRSPWLTKTGEERLIEWRCAVMPAIGDRKLHVLGIGIDMTDRQRTEERLNILHTELDQRTRAYAKVVHDLETSKSELQEKVGDLETFQDVVVGRELKMMALEKQVAQLQRELAMLKMGHAER